MEILNNAFTDDLPEEDVDLLDYYMEERQYEERFEVGNDTPEEVSWESM